MAHRGITTGAALLAAVLGFAFSVHAAYPGYLNADSVSQLHATLTGKLGDWHPPFVAFVWSLLLRLFPGPVGYLVLDNLLIWGSLAVLAIQAGRRAGVASMLLLGIPLVPGLFNFLGHIHKDAMLVAWLLAASCGAYLANRPAATPRRARALRVLALVSLVAAFLTRPNVIFALIPLLLYVNHRLGTRRNLLLCAAMLALMPLAQKTQNALLDVQAEHPGDSIKTFHLLALSHFEGRNLFPGEWTRDESERITNECYTPIQWDSAAPWGKCSFIYWQLNRQQLWGSPALTGAWLKAVARGPLDLYAAMAATYRLSMRDPSSRAMLFKADTTPLVDWHVEIDPPRATTALARDYIQSPFNDVAGRPWVFALVAALGTLLLLGTRSWSTQEGRLALALLLSGQLYQLSYFVFTVSAEYRYFYWSGFAAYAGLVMSVLAIVGARRRGDRPDAAPARAPAAIRAAMAVTALSIGVMAAPFRLPTQEQIVRITSLDGGPLIVSHARPASLPAWTGLRFGGRIDAPGWTLDDSGYRSDVGAPPLVARVRTFDQSVEVGFLTGPGRGSASIESGGVRKLVVTAAAEPGTMFVPMPPAHGSRPELRSVPLYMPARAAIWTLAMYALLAWSERRSRRRPAGIPLAQAAA